MFLPPRLIPVCIAVLAGVLLWAAPGAARWASPTGAPAGNVALNKDAPRALDGVGVDAKEGAQAPLGIALRDETGAPVTLGQLLRSRRPALLTFNYSTCPMLCSLQLDALVGGLRGMSTKLGVDYDVITVSMDPNEDAARNRAFKAKYVANYAGVEVDALPNTPSAATADAGWHFLTGDEISIDSWARAVGFNFRYVPERKEYAHTAAVMVLSADGIVSRYLYGVQFEPRDVRLALAEAAAGNVSSTVDRILLYCFHYDATVGRYAPVAANIMRLMGFVTLVVFGSALALFWWRYEKRAATLS